MMNESRVALLPFTFSLQGLPNSKLKMASRINDYSPKFKCIWSYAMESCTIEVLIKCKIVIVTKMPALQARIRPANCQYLFTLGLVISILIHN